ncbi:MAG TPA: polyprenyl synthetase family protein [Chloroflexota bacterium]
MSTTELLDEIFSRHAPALERELRAAVPSAERSALYAMLAYHFGWVDAEGRPVDVGGGKRLRPTLLLLACQAAGGDPARAMPAAAAVELLHNFSLIHDDIQDRSLERRHRPAVWAVWGVAQAINAGDAMHAAAARTALRCVDGGADPRVALEVGALLHECCLRLVEGQYLDLQFERREDVTAEQYLGMIDGKTASLIATSVETGALLGGAAATREVWRAFGLDLGRAFQIVDDVLGVWGDPRVTGKPGADDVYKGKRALPFLLSRGQLPPRDAARLDELYAPTERTPEQVAEAIALMDRAGARGACRARAAKLLEGAFAELDAAGPTPKGRDELRALARSFVERDR